MRNTHNPADNSARENGDASHLNRGRVRNTHNPADNSADRWLQS